MSLFDKFLKKFVESFSGKNPMIFNVLGNVFSMRIIGNKTHGDLAEIALTEYVNQFINGYSAKHTGKEKFRAKEFEEDIRITEISTKKEIPVSIKTYGFGPLQLSTNKDGSMFSILQEEIGKRGTGDIVKIKKILNNKCFKGFSDVNVLPLIYNEKEMKFKVIVFDLQKAYSFVRKIRFFPPRKLGKKKTFPIYKFFGNKNNYIFEIRYGGAKANALQRGMWTHTENAEPFFKELLVGGYKINEPLIRLIAKILVSRKDTHEKILKIFFDSHQAGQKNLKC